MNSLLKKKILIFLLTYLFINVNGQSEEKAGLRSLGHKRTGIAEPIYVDNPVVVEQPVYYPYPYPYPYSFTYQYPYSYPYQPYQQYYYPYNYSYTYSRTTTRPNRYSAPLGVMPPPPPPPPPYLRYLGQKPVEEPINYVLSENVDPNINDSILDSESANNPSLRQNEIYYPILSESEIQEPIIDDRISRDTSKLTFNNPTDSRFEIFNNTSSNITENSFEDSRERNNTSPEALLFNNTKLRALGGKGIIDRVEKTVNKVFDHFKQNNSTEEDNSDLEKEDEQLNNNNQTFNGKNMIKQVFSTIENIVSTTITS